MKSIIPRTAKVLKVTFLCDTSAYKKGESTVVKYLKENAMWSDGHYSFFISMLRNKNVCKVEVLG